MLNYKGNVLESLVLVSVQTLTFEYDDWAGLSKFINQMKA